MNIDIWLLEQGTAIAGQSRAWWRLPASRRRLEALAAEYFERAREAKRVTRMLDEIVDDAREQVAARKNETLAELHQIIEQWRR